MLIRELMVPRLGDAQACLNWHLHIFHSAIGNQSFVRRGYQTPYSKRITTLEAKRNRLNGIRLEGIRNLTKSLPKVLADIRSSA
jgi:hypothetical protein